MQNKKWKSIFLGFILVASLCLAACGSTANQAPTDLPSPTMAPQETLTPAATEAPTPTTTPSPTNTPIPSPTATAGSAEWSAASGRLITSALPSPRQPMPSGPALKMKNDRVPQIFLLPRLCGTHWSRIRMA